ncbi:hypothetical protein RND61_24740 [Streptomyces sp. TRM76323]|uniref:Uncharacterized protein n=1 Tax=Streptomyces tamarix TaxID=3078565 RepID=A0ABU3QR60_9ACTN|nr:hypothetical protein [Streptomyces tamarix]MDT9685244.1 hypothetical protein [Streptomyces tamarix]
MSVRRPAPAAVHRVRVVVGAGRADVFVDGRQQAAVPVGASPAPGQACGGSTLGPRDTGAVRRPAFARLAVAPLPDRSTTATGPARPARRPGAVR